MELKFGDYCNIEQKRYGSDNEMFQHKVIGTFRSNTYIDVPVQSPAIETIHKGKDPMTDVVACICCGIIETEVLRYRLEDVEKLES